MSLLDCLRPFEPSWPDDRPVRFATSFNAALFEASGRRCIESFREHNRAWEMRAYIEADEPAALDDLARAVEAAGATPIRLDSLPLLSDFLEVARDVIPRELGGEAPEEMFPGTGPQTGDVWFRKHMYRWFRKVVALDDAAAGYDEVLVWLDCDCYCKQPLPLSVLEEGFRGAGLFHMKGRKRKASETGLVGYDLRVPGVRELIEAMRRHYMSRAFLDWPRWDDAYVLDICRQRPDAPAARDVAGRMGPHADVLENSIFGPYFGHDKGLHSRELGLVS